MQIQNPGQVMIVKEMSKVAGEKWKNMTIEERRPYEELSSKSKSEYALLKTLTPDQRLSYHENGGIVVSPIMPHNTYSTWNVSEALGF